MQMGLTVLLAVVGGAEKQHAEQHRQRRQMKERERVHLSPPYVVHACGDD